jgi:hypothetical protein
LLHIITNTIESAKLAETDSTFLSLLFTDQTPSKKPKISRTFKNTLECS